MSNLTHISQEPKVAKNAVDLVSRINPKYHFPQTFKALEHDLRICLGLPFKGKTGGTTAYGYIYNPQTNINEAQRELFKLLWEARRYLYTSSLREVTDWLNFKAGKLGFTQTIGHTGLRNLMILRPPFEECLMQDDDKEKLLESIVAWNQKKTK